MEQKWEFSEPVFINLKVDIIKYISTNYWFYTSIGRGNHGDALIAIRENIFKKH